MEQTINGANAAPICICSAASSRGVCHFPVSHKSICPGRSASPLDKHIGFKLSARQQLQRPRREQTGMWHGMTIKDAFFSRLFPLCRCRHYKLQLARHSRAKASEAKLKGAPSGPCQGWCFSTGSPKPTTHMRQPQMDHAGAQSLQEKPPPTLFFCGLDY